MSSLDIVCSETVWSMVSLCFFPRKWDNKCTSDKIYNTEISESFIFFWEKYPKNHENLGILNKNILLNITQKTYLKKVCSFF